MLGIAYAALIGEVGTLPNTILAGIAEEMYGQQISFVYWMAVGVLLSIIMVFIKCLYLVKNRFSI